MVEQVRVRETREEALSIVPEEVTSALIRMAAWSCDTWTDVGEPGGGATRMRQWLGCGQ